MSQLFANSAPEDICIVRLSAIGDTCHALAVVRNLQDNWPDARITWLIGKTESALMGDIPDVEFIIFDKSEGRRAYTTAADKLAGRSFDVALCMHASMRANFLCRRIPARLKVGFDRARARDFQWLFTDTRIPAASGEHAMEAMMGFARFIGAVEKPLRWDIPIADADRQFARRDTGRPLVVISPCSSQRARNFRNWPEAHFVSIANYLRQDRNADVIVTGGNSELERQYGTSLQTLAQAENLVGRTSLKQLYSLLSAADLVIAPDSGPVHMATTAGTTVIGLYATSNPDRTGPYLSRQYTVNRYPDAVRRYLGKDVEQLRWGQRVRHPEAMSLITVDDVISKIDAFFEK